MPLFAGVCETNITPPLGVWMGGYGLRSEGATSVHDELFARALVVDSGDQRVALVVADVVAFAPNTVVRVRSAIAHALGTSPQSVMLHATHTHGGPNIGIFRAMGDPDLHYVDLLERKLIGVAKQAAQNLYPAHFTYGETSAQIGVNRRQLNPTGKTQLGVDYAGAVDPRVQTLCVNHTDGRLLALLFCHACHPTTVGGDNLSFTAEWCGAAAQHLQNRLRSDEASALGAPLAFFLQGCCGDINPNRRGSWEAVHYNGAVIGNAAHEARWNAHGRLDSQIEAKEITVSLPLLPPAPLAEIHENIVSSNQRITQLRKDSAPLGALLQAEAMLAWAQDCLHIAENPNAPKSHPFSIQCLNLGGVSILGFPAEMFVQYALDFSQQMQMRSPGVFSLSYSNGCWNYLPTAIEYERGGYEVEEAYKYYGTQMFAPESEAIVRSAAYHLLRLENADETPYPLVGFPPR